MRNNKTWITNCKICGRSLSNYGSGRPKNNCGKHKKIKILVGKAESERRRLAFIANKCDRQHALVNAIKMSVGECYYHEQYYGHELLVSEQTMRAFCWDHIDRTDKVATISQMIGRNTDDEILEEIGKCVLSCTNCHQIKTYEHKDYKWLEQAKEVVKIIDTQLKLFAC